MKTDPSGQPNGSNSAETILRGSADEVLLPEIQISVARVDDEYQIRQVLGDGDPPNYWPVSFKSEEAARLFMHGLGDEEFGDGNFCGDLEMAGRILACIEKCECRHPLYLARILAAQRPWEERTEVHLDHDFPY